VPEISFGESYFTITGVIAEYKPTQTPCKIRTISKMYGFCIKTNIPRMKANALTANTNCLFFME
jgi:hypothetical protein